MTKTKPKVQKFVVGGKKLVLNNDWKTLPNLLSKPVTNNWMITMTMREWLGEGKEAPSAAEPEFVKFDKGWASSNQTMALCAEHTDNNPKGQRPPRKKFRGKKKDPKHDTKSASIIESLLYKGLSPGLITLSYEVENDFSTSIFAYESVDGGHRKRSFTWFREGKLAISSDCGTYMRTWDGLSPAEQESFLDIELVFLVYTGLTNRKKGELFRKINIATKINDQQGLNSFGDTDMANYIRCVVDERGDEYPLHKLFETSGVNDERFIHLKDSNQDLKLEELVTRSLWLIDKKELIGATKEDYEDFMDTGEVKEKEFNDFLTMMLKLRKGKKDNHTSSTNRLTSFEWRVFLFLWIEKKFTILPDMFEEFWDVFAKALRTAQSEEEEGNRYWTEVIDISGTKEKTRYRLFKEYTVDWKNAAHMKQVVEWLCVELDLNDLVEDEVIVFRKKKRGATSKEKETVFSKQGHYCKVELELKSRGVFPKIEKVKITDCDVAHIDSYAMGSGCEIDDFHVVRRYWHNGSKYTQGQMNFDEYIDYLVKNLKEKKVEYPFKSKKG